MTTGQPPAPFALAAHIFHAAMQRQVPLDAYAAALALPADTLQAVLSAQAEQVAPDVLAALAAVHGQPLDAGLAPGAPAAEAEPFSGWLERQMEGAPQSSLRTRAQLEPRLLRAFLSGKQLPDADQAARLARALYVDSAEMAGIIVADMARRAGRPPVQTQRRKSTGTGAVATPVPPPPDTAPPPAEGPAPARRGKQRAGSAAPPAASARTEEAEQTPHAPVPAHTPAPPSEADAVAPPGLGRSKRGPRQPAAPEAGATSPADSTAPQQQPAAAVTPSVAIEGGPPPPAEPHVGSTGVAPPAAPSEAPAPRRRARARAAGGAIAAAGGTGGPPHGSDEPGAVAATTAGAPGATGDDQRDRDGGAMGPGAIGARAGAARPEAPERAAAPPLAAAVTSPAIALELSADEVRLLYSYRRLHPHGRRATLQYIGSLLVED